MIRTPSLWPAILLAAAWIDGAIMMATFEASKPRRVDVST
jgi:hypothetical protein